jgi:hypothetical protein
MRPLKRCRHAHAEAKPDEISGQPTKNAGMITIFLILALGLAVVGILSRVVIKTVAARRAESQMIDNQPSMYPSMNGESSTHLYRPYIGRKRFRPIPSRGRRLPDRPPDQ